MEDHNQDVYGALEKNINLKEQIKQKLRKGRDKYYETMQIADRGKLNLDE